MRLLAFRSDLADFNLSSGKHRLVSHVGHRDLLVALKRTRDWFAG
jgi:hypothetical protein